MRDLRASDLRDLLVRLLVRREGGSARGWRLAVGRIRVYDTATHPDVNWRIEPAGDDRENAAVERLLDEVRLTHSIVLPD